MPFAWEFRVFHDFYWLQEIIRSRLLSALRLRNFHIKVSGISPRVSKVTAWCLVGRRVDGIKAGLGGPSVRNPVGKEIFFPAYRHWDSPNLPYGGNQPWLSHGSAAAVVWRLTTQPTLVQRLRIGTAILPLLFYDFVACYRVAYSLFAYIDLSQAQMGRWY